MNYVIKVLHLIRKERKEIHSNSISNDIIIDTSDSIDIQIESKFLRRKQLKEIKEVKE